MLGAVDGPHVPILISGEEHMDYIHRKGQHYVVFQGIAVGTTLKFVGTYGGWACSVHDPEVFKNSSIAHIFKEGFVKD